MRHGYVSYWKLPFGLGEVQYGHRSTKVILWFRGRCFRLRKGRNPFV